MWLHVPSPFGRQNASSWDGELSPMNSELSAGDRGSNIGNCILRHTKQCGGNSMSSRCPHGEQFNADSDCCWTASVCWLACRQLSRHTRHLSTRCNFDAPSPDRDDKVMADRMMSSVCDDVACGEGGGRWRHADTAVTLIPRSCKLFYYITSEVLRRI